MTEMYYENPFAYWAWGYVLIYLFLLIHAWQETSMNIRLALYLLLWPVIAALMIIVVGSMLLADLAEKILKKRERK